jgi:hypothetical protein
MVVINIKIEGSKICIYFFKILGKCFIHIKHPCPSLFNCDASITLQMQNNIYFCNIYSSPPRWGFDVPLAMSLCKTFLLRMLNDS